MKKLFSFILLALALLVSPLAAIADAVYPYNNPTYVPAAVSPAVAFTAPSTAYIVTLHNRSVIAYEINGTCTSLAATVQVTVDGTNWRTVNVYPVATGTITAAASITAAGAYRANVAGGKTSRLNISALTASCSVSAVAIGSAPSLTQ